MTKRNPKQEGSNLWDCKTQIGNCPMNCNQCFANRPGAAYIPMDEQILPTVEEVGDGIVRANCLHDSNYGRQLLIDYCEQYKKVFYNTSIPKFDFPGPVVFTANAKEEEPVCVPQDIVFKASVLPKDIVEFYRRLKDELPSNIMFVRLRVSTTNLEHIEHGVHEWTQSGVPVVLTFMAYYEEDAIPGKWFNENLDRSCIDRCGSCNFLCYEHKVRHINSYWCPTKDFMVYVLKRMKNHGGRLVTMCATPDSYSCKDCRNCETYYYQTMKHMREIE